MSEQRSLTWNKSATPEEVHAILETLAADFPIRDTSGEGSIRFTREPDAQKLRVRVQDGVVDVEYGAPHAAIRGVAHALAGREADEEAGFPSLGIMLDCSRNAVMKVSYVKQWLRQLALLGYNRVMLYTEDTYQLPGEPYFGYMRGAYSAEEVREIDGYAAALGIEVIACIQTLGHLAQILKWPYYGEVADTSSVLLVDEEKTYDLIEKMLKFWAENLGTRRIHLGMDEAHDLGRGKFLDRFGYQPPFEIFNRHLGKISQMCQEHGLRPMIWSDMYFRMGSAGNSYYDRDCVIPEEVVRAIPKEVDLVYWDYYTADEEFYREWINRHRALGHEPLMASGVWTWARFWYDHEQTERAVRPCMAACRKEGVSELWFTMWGDGGAYCDFDSAFLGLAWAADLAFGGDGREEDVAPVLKAATGYDYGSLMAGTRINLHSGEGKTAAPSIPAVLWDDPILGIGWQGLENTGENFWPNIIAQLETVQTELALLKDSVAAPDYGYLFDIISLAVEKLKFRRDLVEAYGARDKAALLTLAGERLKGVEEIIKNLQTSFRRQWLRRNKPFGMEVIQIRFGALLARCGETRLRLEEVAEGKLDRIDELEEPLSPDAHHRLNYFYWLTTGSSVL